MGVRLILFTGDGTKQLTNIACPNENFHPPYLFYFWNQKENLNAKPTSFFLIV